MPNLRLRGAPPWTPAGAPAPDPLCKWGQIRTLYRYTGHSSSEWADPWGSL